MTDHDPYMAIAAPKSSDAQEPQREPEAPATGGTGQTDPETGAAEVQVEGGTPVAVEPETRVELEEAIGGSAADVMRVVGDDQQLAQLALELEQARDKPRKGLSNQLREVLGQEQESDEE